MNFKTKVGYYISTTKGYTDAEVQQYIIDGCFDVIRKVEGIEGIQGILKFGTWSANITAQDYDIDEKRRILLVKRNEIPAQEVDPFKFNKYTDTDSIYYADDTDPVYYRMENILTILPAPDTSGSGSARFLSLGYANSSDVDYSVTNYDGTSSIDSFPAEYYDHVLLYASHKIADALSHAYLEDDEDAELTQLMASRSSSLKAQYLEMFGAAE